MSDPIDRQAAIDIVMHYGKRIPTYAIACKEGIEQLPSVQRKVLKYTGESICLYCQTVNCDGCMYEPMKGEQE